MAVISEKMVVNPTQRVGYKRVMPKFKKMLLIEIYHTI